MLDAAHKADISAAARDVPLSSGKANIVTEALSSSAA